MCSLVVKFIVECGRETITIEGLDSMLITDDMLMREINAKRATFRDEDGCVPKLKGQPVSGGEIISLDNFSAVRSLVQEYINDRRDTIPIDLVMEPIDEI